MFLIAFRIAVVLASAYLFGLLVAWLFSLFNGSDGGGGDFGGDEPIPPVPPEPGKTSNPKKSQKRWVEVDESYYLEEFNLNKKQ